MLSDQPTQNQILSALPQAVREELTEAAVPFALPAGDTIAAAGAPLPSVLFPTSGVIAGVGTLAGGHEVQVASIGSEGMIGVSQMLGLSTVTVWMVVQVPASGYAIPHDRVARLFDTSPDFRRAVLAHCGRLLVDLAQSAVCNRFHSHRERLARWLAVTAAKAMKPSLELTHDFIARMVGGPRHAVTSALQELSDGGVIHHHRGQIEILDHGRLMREACECAGHATRTTSG